MAGEGNKYFYILTAIESSTPLPEENAEESLPMSQGMKYFLIEFAVLVLIWWKFSFSFKTKRFLLLLLWALANQIRRGEHSTYFVRKLSIYSCSRKLVSPATSKPSRTMFKTGVYTSQGELWDKAKTVGLTVEDLTLGSISATYLVWANHWLSFLKGGQRHLLHRAPFGFKEITYMER